MAPLIQILHISDLHVSVTPPPPRATRWLKQPFFRDVFHEGMAMWDRLAHVKAHEALVHDDVVGGWNGPTCLVATGDISTFGDAKSIARGLGIPASVAAVDSVVLRGNHDTWPGDFPLGASTKALATQRAHLAAVLPDPPVGLPKIVSNGVADAQIFSLDTTHVDRWKNLAALGHANGAQALSEQIWSHADVPRPTFRVVLTHHPMVFPKGKRWDRLNGQAKRDLAAYTRPALSPHVHLLLSGHTHQEWPPRSELSNALQTSTAYSLARNQLQLVIGSFSQSIGHERSGERRQQFQVIRVSSEEETFEVERRLYERAPRSPFEVVATESVIMSA